MLPVEIHTHISASREEVFDLISDMSRRAAWCPHLEDFRLASPRSSGLGASARFRLDAPFARRWAETTITEAERPRRIVERGRTGRLGRTRTVTEWDLTRQAGVTRVELRMSSQPGNVAERMRESFGLRGWLRRRSQKSLERLRRIFEEPSGQSLERTSIAGFEPLKAARFGVWRRVSEAPGDG